MKAQISQILARLKKPSVILSLVSQIISMLVLMGISVNENLVITICTMICSILITFGILSNPDSTKKGYTDDLLVCSKSAKTEPHVMINGQMVCTVCGAVYQSN